MPGSEPGWRRLTVTSDRHGVDRPRKRHLASWLGAYEPPQRESASDPAAVVLAVQATEQVGVNGVWWDEGVQHSDVCCHPPGGRNDEVPSVVGHDVVQGRDGDDDRFGGGCGKS